MKAWWKLLYRTALLAVLAGSGLPGAASAANAAPAVTPPVRNAEGPVIPPAQRDYSPTQRCVMPLEDMRKNHMKYLLHNRWLVVHEGIRNPKFNIQSCVNCHASYKPDGKAIPIDSPGQFCFNCHKYAGVQIDCFECHRDLPSTNSYLHPLVSGFGPHHIQFSQGDSLSSGTLDALVTKGAEK